MSDTEILNPDAIEGLRSLSPEGDSEFLRELIAIYLSDTPKNMHLLAGALASRDAAGLTYAAHTIKGSSSNFGATRMSRVAQEIENQGKAADFARATSAFENLKAEFALVTAELNKIAAEA